MLLFNRLHYIRQHRLQKFLHKASRSSVYIHFVEVLLVVLCLAQKTGDLNVQSRYIHRDMLELATELISVSA